MILTVDIDFSPCACSPTNKAGGRVPLSEQISTLHVRRIAHLTRPQRDRYAYACLSCGCRWLVWYHEDERAWAEGHGVRDIGQVLTRRSREVAGYTGVI